jgi:orotate phosphoribosyltransferase-like protein
MRRVKVMSKLIDKANELIASNLSQTEILDELDVLYKQAETDKERENIRELFNPIFAAEEAKYITITWKVWDKDNNLLSVSSDEVSAIKKCDKSKGEYIRRAREEELIGCDFEPS